MALGTGALTAIGNPRAYHFDEAKAVREVVALLVFASLLFRILDRVARSPAP